MRSAIGCVMVAGIIGLHTSDTLGDVRTLGLVPSSLVDHPVNLPTGSRTASVWRQKVGAWAENVADQTLRLRGFQEVYEIKTAGNHGIDRVALRRGPDGVIRDVRLVEVKASRGRKPTLKQTQYGGRQMSRKWLAQNLRAMRNSGDASLKKLALEISRFRKASGVNVEALGEVMHFDTRNGRLTGYFADGRAVRYSQSINGLLQDIQTKGRSSATRRWATRSLAAWDQIRHTGMASWLGKSTADQSRTALLASRGRTGATVRQSILRQSRGAATRQVLGRAAGPLATVIALALDVKEMADTERAYKGGAISLRERNIRQITKLGGMSGAFAGAWAGAAMGTWIGAFGGPFAEITMPAGALIGMTIGGIGGYIGGSAVAGYAATSWYDAIDASVRHGFERDWIARPIPDF